MTKPAWLAPWLAELGGKGKDGQRPSSPEREREQSAQERHAERWHPRAANSTPTRPAGPSASSSPTRSSFARSSAEDVQLSAYTDKLRIDEPRQSIPDARELARGMDERVWARSAAGQPVAVDGSSAFAPARTPDKQSMRPPLPTPPSRSPPKGPRPPPDRPQSYSPGGAWPTIDTFERSSPGSYRPQASPGGFVDPRVSQAQPRPPVYSTLPRPFSAGPSFPYAGTHSDGPQHAHALPKPPPRFPTPSVLASSSLTPGHTRAQTHSSPTAPASARTAVKTQPPLLRPYSDSAASTSACQSPVSPPKASTRATPASPRAVKPNQCHGTTGAGKRCTRVVGASKSSGTPKKNVTPSKEAAELRQSGLSTGALQQLDRRLSIGRRKREAAGGKVRTSPSKLQQTTVTEVDSSESDEDFDRPIGRLDNALAEDEDAQLEELPVYCFQHAKQTLEQKGIFIGSCFIDFDEWIPEYLPRDTKLQLRHEISKPVSGGDDTPGYIYVHEMATSDVNSGSTTFIKLGRSIKPVARLNQWKAQCRSRSPVVRGIFPQHASQERTAALLQSGSPAQVHGALSFAAKGLAHHHRWERLCLIELAGLAAHQSAQRQGDTAAQGRCSDCAKIHVELFLVDRGSYESAIRGMVLKWQAFVEMLP